jgi:signal transduction histidine kinase
VIWLEATADPKASSVKLVIADTGVGIQDKHHRQLFDPFFSTKAEGTGLRGIGLHTAKNIIEEHGGMIWAERFPKNGKGAEFIISLPLNQDVSIESATAKEQ